MEELRPSARKAWFAKNRGEMEEVRKDLELYGAFKEYDRLLHRNRKIRNQLAGLEKQSEIKPAFEVCDFLHGQKSLLHQVAAPAAPAVQLGGEFAGPAEFGSHGREEIAAWEGDEFEGLFGSADFKGISGSELGAGQAIRPDFNGLEGADVLDLDFLGGGKHDGAVGNGMGGNWGQHESF